MLCRGETALPASVRPSTTSARDGPRILPTGTSVPVLLRWNGKTGTWWKHASLPLIGPMSLYRSIKLPASRKCSACHLYLPSDSSLPSDRSKTSFEKWILTQTIIYYSYLATNSDFRKKSIKSRIFFHLQNPFFQPSLLNFRASSNNARKSLCSIYILLFAVLEFPTHRQKKVKLAKLSRLILHFAIFWTEFFVKSGRERHL